VDYEKNIVIPVLNVMPSVVLEDKEPKKKKSVVSRQDSIKGKE
jgi:hypothetical protein